MSAGSRSIVADSITTDGGRSLARSLPGSITTTPSWVGNQNRPSLSARLAGCRPPLHSLDSMPSPMP